MDQYASRPYDAPEVAHSSTPQPYPELLPYHEQHDQYDLQRSYAHTFSVENSVPQKTTEWRGVLLYLLGLAALLAAVAVGLAAGVGVEARRANHAEALLAAETALKANRTSSTGAATYDAIDRNCSSNAPAVTGTTYASYPLNGDLYTIYCFEFATKVQLMAIFTHDFDSCMDACSAYNRYTSVLKLVNQTSNRSLQCGAVTFVPPWTNKTAAAAASDGADGADGNCFLKEAQTAAEFWKVTMVSDYHSGLRNK